MSTYRIVCTILKYPTQHRHISEVGTGTDPAQATDKWTVQRVRNALDAGDTFYTADSQGNRAGVHKFDCGCGYRTIRSAADATQGNNLDYLRQCSFP